MGIPESYQLVKTCFSCRHIFIRDEFDDAPTLFCCRDGVARPLCGSVLMGEGFLEKTNSQDPANFNKAVGELREAWGKWADEHAVAEYGVCDEWGADDKA